MAESWLFLKSFETIFKSITDGVLIVDPRGYIILANQTFKDILKIDESPEGKQIIEIIRNIDLLNLFRSATLSKGESAEEIVIKKAGKEMVIFVRVMPVFDSAGNLSFLIILLHDITRLKKLETIRRDFVANVSHELKTPITAIKGYAEALLGGALKETDNALKFVQIIKNQAERLLALVEDLLMISRIEFGDINIQKEYILVEEVVDTVFQIFHDKAEKKGLDLKKEIPSGATIYADRDKIVQILTNLVDNAVKFTEKGEVTVRFFRENMNSVISVEDTGIGIPAGHLHRLGERFYRVDKARSRQLGGTGLGLAIVKHLVKAHHGDLKIESEQGAGTKVKIIIPEKPRDISP